MWVAGEIGEGLLASCQHQPVLVWCAFLVMAVLDVSSKHLARRTCATKTTTPHGYVHWCVRMCLCACLCGVGDLFCPQPPSYLYLPASRAHTDLPLQGRTVLRTQPLRASLHGCPVTTQLPRKIEKSAGSRQLKDALASTEKRGQRAGNPQPSRPSSEHSAK